MASLAVIVAAASGGLAVVLVKKNLDRMNSFKLTLTQLLFGLGFLLMIGLLTESTSTFKLNGRVAAAVIYLGTVGTAFAFVLYYRLLREMSAITISLIVYITPVIALIVDYIFLGEIIQLRSVVGMLVIFAGIGLNQINFRPSRS